MIYVSSNKKYYPEEYTEENVRTYTSEVMSRCDGLGIKYAITQSIDECEQKCGAIGAPSLTLTFIYSGGFLLDLDKHGKDAVTASLDITYQS